MGWGRGGRGRSGWGRGERSDRGSSPANEERSHYFEATWQGLSRNSSPSAIIKIWCFIVFYWCWWFSCNYQFYLIVRCVLRALVFFVFMMLMMFMMFKIYQDIISVVQLFILLSCSMRWHPSVQSQEKSIVMHCLLCSVGVIVVFWKARSKISNCQTQTETRLKLFQLLIRPLQWQWTSN